MRLRAEEGKAREVVALAHEGVYPCPVADVEFDGAGFTAAVFLHEGVEPILTSPDCDHFAAFFDEPVG